MTTQPFKVANQLKTPKQIAAYLNAAIEENGDDPRLLMKALRNAVEAAGGVSEVARQIEVDRSGLSRGLSGDRFPRLDTIAKVADALGVKLRFAAVSQKP